MSGGDMTERLKTRRAAVFSALLMGTTALAGLMAPAPALAQTTAPAQRHFNIPAQPLREALLIFSQQSGLQVTAQGPLVEGRTGAAVSGDLAPAEALSRLLTGTGLTFRFDGRDAVRLELAPQSADGAIQLGPVRVEGDAGRADGGGYVSLTSDPGATEGTASYKPRVSNTATRLTLTPRETPQTITVVTRQQMDDFGLISVDDALEATSGVIVQNAGLNGSQYYSRGFTLQSQYDGIPNPVGISQGNLGPQVDSAALDRVEVLQGASGLTSGAGYPGGTINLVRKRPTRSFQAQAEAQLGSWDQRRLVGDVSGPLMESGHIRGRLVGVADDSDSFVDYVYNHRRGAYGIIEADLMPNTTAFASIQYQKDKGINHLGVPFGSDGHDLGLSRSAFFGNPNSRNTKDNTLYTIGLDHRIVSDWRLKISYQHGDVNADQSNYSAPGSGGGNQVRLSQVLYITTQNRYDAIDAFVSGYIQLFGRVHELVFGINGSDYHMESQHSGWVTNTTPINPYSFDPAAIPNAPMGRLAITDNKTTQYGAYGVGRFNLSDSVKLITGVRISSYELRNKVTGTTTQKERDVVSPYAGLIYDINKQFSAYVSYADIFQPQSNRSASGDTLKPVIGSNYEAGIKGELLDGKLNVAVAVFRLEQTNLATIDTAVPYGTNSACGGWCYLAADKVVSQGIDLSINGEVQPGWSVSGGYTYVDSEYASGVQKGRRYLTIAPQHSLRLASSYKIPNTKLSVGGDARAYSSIKNSGTYSGTPYAIRQGGRILVGLRAMYEVSSHADVSLLINNLFDKRYYTYITQLYNAPYGEPRNFSVNLEYRF